MSCIKFPSTKNDITVSKTTSKESDYAAITDNLIAKANKMFGERNWSHSITNQTLDFIDYVQGKYQAGGVSIVRIQLKDGIFHEDMGYNSSEGSSKGSAIQRVRLGSYNVALKKVLSYFESDTFNRETQSLSRSNSPPPIQPVKHLPIEASATGPSISNKIEKKSSPPPIESVKNLPIEASATVPPISNKIDSDQFEDIPMSQTDALMNIVDLDQICGKDQNLNTVVNADAADFPKPSTSTGKDSPFRNTNGLRKNLEDGPKILATTVSSAKSVTTFKKEEKIDSQKIMITSTPKPEVSKPIVYTAMTEEEMRLERKRKQREMQEEFKRKEEIKRKHCTDRGSVQTRNPRY